MKYFSLPGESADCYADLLMRNSEPVQGEISRHGDTSQAHCYARPCNLVSALLAEIFITMSHDVPWQILKCFFAASLASANRCQAPLTSSWSRSGCCSQWSIPSLKLSFSALRICWRQSKVQKQSRHYIKLKIRCFISCVKFQGLSTKTKQTKTRIRNQGNK